MAEAERTIETPETPDAPGAGETGPLTPADGTAPGGAGDGGTTDRDTAAGDPVAGADGATAVAAKGRRRLVALFTVAVVAYLLDLISKTLVVAKLEHHAPVEIIGDWLKLEAVRNPGAAFSMGEAFTVVFTVIASAVIVVIVRLARKLRSLPWAIALGLLLGGALGNLTDRLFRAPGVFKGAVVDFISPAHFAVFNLADSAIVCGGILIVILSFRGLDPDGTVHKD
ncbi:signal peptidase II [Streptomyces sp. NPDC060198]|uniref:signal peptidase II n=1 Tax=Streptomyces sp. NPDC060198 TaxID=3347070 RepID=UPI00365370DF